MIEGALSPRSFLQNGSIVMVIQSDPLVSSVMSVAGHIIPMMTTNIVGLPMSPQKAAHFAKFSTPGTSE